MESINRTFEQMNELQSKLSILYNLSWKTPDSYYNKNIIEYISKLKSDDLESFYEFSKKEQTSDDIDKNIKNSLIENLYFQKILKMKRSK